MRPWRMPLYRFDGVMGRASASRAEDMVSNPGRSYLPFFSLSSFVHPLVRSGVAWDRVIPVTSKWVFWWLASQKPNVMGVRPRTGWRGVSILLLDERASMISDVYISTAARQIVQVDWPLGYTLHVAGTWGCLGIMMSLLSASGAGLSSPLFVPPICMLLGRAWGSCLCCQQVVMDCLVRSLFLPFACCWDVHGDHVSAVSKW